MTSVAIVLGPARPGRAGEQVVRWIEEQARQVDGVATVFFDLRDYNLPLFAEEMPPSMQAPELPEAVRLRTNIEAQDAVLFVTPEYNHSVSAVLKNAIDYLPPVTLKDKAVGLVGYSWYGAATPLSTCVKLCRRSELTFVGGRSVSTLVLTSRTAFSSPPMSSTLRSASSLPLWRERPS